ncbi:MAG: ABC transporter ATP-binding protein [Myxococcota bacterium]
MSPVPLVELRGVRKSFGTTPETKVQVLHGIDLVVQPGELISLIGPSGSGKSTLLNLLGLLDRPTSGSLKIRGQEVAELSDGALTRLRGETLGFVFQFHHLLPGLSVVENVMLPAAALSGSLNRSQRPRAESLLESMGLFGQADRLAKTLSGGMQQRVAIARALMNQPALVFADEPTGNLDTETTEQVMTLLKQQNREQNTAFVIVTHDPALARQCERIVRLVDGRVVYDGPPDDGSPT